MVWYTLAAIILYLASDWILDQVEIKLGKRLQYRNIVFFGIITVLALIVFQSVQYFVLPQA